MLLSSTDLSRSTLNRQSWLLGGVILLLLVLGNYQQAAIGFDSRFVMFAQEMLRHGPSFFPTTYGEPYPDYSATSTFFIYLLSLPFGQVSSFTAWLPTAISGAIIAMLVFRLVGSHSRQWAAASIAWMLLSITFITEARAVSLDLMLAAVAVAVFYTGYAADHFGAPRRTVGLLALLVLGFAIRGPIGLVVPTGMLCSYYLLSGQFRRLFIFGLMALALLLLGIGVLLLLAEHTGGAAFVQDVIRMQVTGRIDGSEGASGPLYYFTSSLGNYALAYPFALLVLAAVLATGRADRGPKLQLISYAAAAGLIVMIGLSIPLAKKARYLLPMLPMAAIIAGYPFAVIGTRTFSFIRRLTLGLWWLMPALLFATLCVGHHRMPEALGSITPILVLLAVLQAAATFLLFKPSYHAMGLATTAVAAVWATYILVVEPVERQMYDTQSLTQSVMQLVDADSATLVLHGMGKDAKAIKFMVNVDRDFHPAFTDTAKQLEAIAAPAYALMTQQDFNKLKATPLGALAPVLRDRFDKDDYVLLRLGQQPLN